MTRTSILTTSFLFVVAAYVLLPVWWVVVSATKSGADLFTTNPLWFSGLHLGDNLDRVMTQDHGLFTRWVLNTLLYAGGGALGAMMLAAMAGYALSKFPFRGRNLLFGIIMTAVLLPLPLLTIPLYLLESKIGLLNTVWGVLLPCMVSPFGVYLARAYAQVAVPDELLDAGRMDGAGEVRLFFTVGLRLMAPAMVTLFPVEPPRVCWRLDQKGRSSPCRVSPPTLRSCAVVRSAWSARSVPSTRPSSQRSRRWPRSWGSVRPRPCARGCVNPKSIRGSGPGSAVMSRRS